MIVNTNQRKITLQVRRLISGYGWRQPKECKFCTRLIDSVKLGFKGRKFNSNSYFVIIRSLILKRNLFLDFRQILTGSSKPNGLFDLPGTERFNPFFVSWETECYVGIARPAFEFATTAGNDNILFTIEGID